MSKGRDINQIFKDGFEDYKVKPDSNLEEKMAAMINAGSGNSGSEDVSESGGTSSGAISGSGIIGGGGVISQTGSSLLHLAGIKMTMLVKSLGLLKIIGTIALLVGGAAIIVNKLESSKTPEAIHSKQLSRINTKAHQTIAFGKALNLQTTSFIPENEEQMVKAQKKLYEDYLLADQKAILQKDPLNSVSDHLPASLENESSNIASAKELKPQKQKEVNIDKSVPILFEGKTKKLFHSQTIPLLKRDTLILKTDVPQPKKMSTLEKGFYLPNYDITAGASFMPLMAWQIYDNDFFNDSVTSYQFKYNPQLSWQIGAEIRLQKKRSPWFAQIGINYQNLNVKSDYRFDLEYVDWNQSYWNIDTVNYEIIINPPNVDTLLDIDSSYYYHKIKSISAANSIDHYHSLEIPIKIGYQYKKHGKPLSFEAAIGIAPSVLLSASGKTYYWSTDFSDFTIEDVKPQWNFYAIGHIGINYQHKNTVFFIRPSFKYQLIKSEYKNATEKNQFLIFGAQIGVRFKLFKNAGQP